MADDAYRKHYAFTDAVQEEVGKRQNWLCAACGKSLGTGNTTTLANVHHVIPAIAGTPSNSADDFIKTADNGVLLCDDSTDEDKTRGDHCHAQVGHGGGRFKSFAGFLDAFKHSHGEDTTKHAKWVQKMSAKKPSKWGE